MNIKDLLVINCHWLTNVQSTSLLRLGPTFLQDVLVTEWGINLKEDINWVTLKETDNFIFVWIRPKSFYRKFVCISTGYLSHWIRFKSLSRYKFDSFKTCCHNGCTFHWRRKHGENHACEKIGLLWRKRITLLYLLLNNLYNVFIT